MTEAVARRIARKSDRSPSGAARHAELRAACDGVLDRLIAGTDPGPLLAGIAAQLRRDDLEDRELVATVERLTRLAAVSAARAGALEEAQRRV